MTRPPPIPEGYGTVTPWVVTKDTRRLLEFIEDAFDAEELAWSRGDGLGHAEARIGDSHHDVRFALPGGHAGPAAAVCRGRRRHLPPGGRPPAPPR